MGERLMHRKEFYIGGEWVAPAVDEHLDVVSPWSEKVVGSVPVATTEDMDRAVSAARRAFEGSWAQTSRADRGEILKAVAENVRKRVVDLVDAQVEEMAIPVASGYQQNEMIAPLFDYYGELAVNYPFERHEIIGPNKAVIVQEPVGVVGAIVPWNGPTCLAAWKIAPALAAGCTVVLKPPPEAPVSSLVLAEILHEAGLPAGVLNVVPGGREVGEYLVTHKDTDKISFTGSTGAGKRIMSLCGDQIKRVSLELGGKSAAIFLDDADLQMILPRYVRGAMHNSGQVCAMLSRALVPRHLYDDAAELAARTAATFKIGDPHDDDTVIGPLVAKRQQDRVLGYIDIATSEGARILTGGKAPAEMATGFYVEPTVLAGVEPHMRVAQEEIFGPVLSFIPYGTEEEAVAIANGTSFGLTAAVFGGDQQRAMAVARRLQAGSVSVNGGYGPYPRTSFGGFKESGLGRELGTEGLGVYLEPKSIAYR
ncbi:aldehyde dehydrogenase [Frankia sp. R43]|uniref:aldehyde dehydrogenase n=1 Tax=Frankia sp. R43 TaxID=269536 RepID=UPI0006C9EFFD|nr:aldehyde dehydrogenase [Frankia sp. R43]KPM51961.1 aldehyde dehydrogenase [Frankia sp. R43]